MENQTQKVLHIIDDYYLGADAYNLLLYKKKLITGDGNKTAKPENVGKEVYSAVGYYNSLAALSEGLSKRFLIDEINSDEVKDLRDLAKAMIDLADRVRSIESGYFKLLEERMKRKDAGESEDRDN